MMNAGKGLRIFQYSTMRRVLDLLPEDGSPITAQELKKKAREQKMGYDTLFKYLKKLENWAVLRYVDTSQRPPKVLYRRLSHEEIFGMDKKTCIELMEHLDKISTILKRLGRKIPLRKWKHLYTSWGLTYFLIFPTLVVARARELEPAKREEYINTMMHVHFYPSLLNKANHEGITSEDWIGALKELAEWIQKKGKVKPKPEELVRKAPKKYRPELGELLKELEKRETHADNP